MTTTEKRNDLKFWNKKRIERIYNNELVQDMRISETNNSLDNMSSQRINKEYNETFGDVDGPRWYSK